MLYTSQMEAIWIKISTERPINRQETSRDSFRRVCEAFVQAEERPPSAGLSREIKSFIAERKIWAYYFGGDVPFPGVDPAAASPPTLNTPLIAQPLSVQQEFVVPSAQANRAAAAMKRKLLAEWQDKPYRQGYKPKFGWNPTTGEPWLAMRCYAEGAYPALSGRNMRYMLELSQMEERFVLRFEKFADDGYTLIWPELKHKLDLVDKELWKKFIRFRGFLEEWALKDGDWRAPISNSYQEFLLRSDPTDQGPPLPVGFEHSLASLSRESLQSQPQDRYQHQPQPTPPRVETTLAFRPRGRERSRSPLTRSSRRCASPHRDDYRRGGTGLGSSSLGRPRGVMVELEQDIINPSSYGSRRRRRSRSPLMRNSRRSASPPEDPHRRRLGFGSSDESSRAVKKELEEDIINKFDDLKLW